MTFGTEFRPIVMAGVRWSSKTAIPTYRVRETRKIWVSPYKHQVIDVTHAYFRFIRPIRPGAIIAVQWAPRLMDTTYLQGITESVCVNMHRAAGCSATKVLGVCEYAYDSSMYLIEILFKYIIFN